MSTKVVFMKVVTYKIYEEVRLQHYFINLRRTKLSLVTFTKNLNLEFNLN